MSISPQLLPALWKSPRFPAAGHAKLVRQQTSQNFIHAIDPIQGVAAGSSQRFTLPNGSASRSCRITFEQQTNRIVVAHATASHSATSGEVSSGSKLPASFLPITSEEHLDAVLGVAEARGEGIVIDWMAQWCRKCIYLQPKLEKLALDYPDVKFCVVDVNAVPSSLVKRGGVAKMPTIQLWRKRAKVAEIIGGQESWKVMDDMRKMLKDH